MAYIAPISALPWNFKMGDSPEQNSVALGEKCEDRQQPVYTPVQGVRDNKTQVVAV